VARSTDPEKLLLSANAKVDAILPDTWEADESDKWIRQARIPLRGMTLFVRQFRERGHSEPFRNVVDLRLRNGDRKTLDDGRGAIAGWHPGGLGDPFNLDVADQILNQVLKESL
jgi:hypothetical protein